MTSKTPLKFLGPAWFSVVMGLSGLALAWLSAAPALGDMATGLGLVLAGLAGVLCMGLLVLSLLRWQRHPLALAEDLKHPVRHPFVASLPVALLLLSTLGVTLDLPQAICQPVWWLGSLTQLWATVWVLGRWLAPQTGDLSQPGALWPGVTPALFIPVVGNVVAPLAGVPLGHSEWSLAQFGIGAAFWPVVLVLLLTRRLTHGPVPDRLLVTWVIAVAPPAVIGLSLLRFGASETLAQALWGVAAFTLVWVASQVKRMINQPFSLPYWALSFPLAALTTLTLQLAERHALVSQQSLGLVLLAVTSLIVLALGMATVRGLRDGTLLAPEPIAQIIPASA